MKQSGVSQSEDSIPPFLKWAGGKRWLVDNHPQLFPSNVVRYVEPFLGSGAAFFKLRPKNALLADSNRQLIETYKAIRGEWNKVAKLLARHDRSHCREYYYYMRDAKPRSEVARAAQFVYLNRTCWNGLYRVNLQGKFNVPIGTKARAVLASDNFEEVAKLLESADIRWADFEEVFSMTGSGDFIFADPPYTVRHNNNGFLKYNESIFSWADQVRLRDCVVGAISRGATVLVSNAAHRSVRDLYRGIGKIHLLERKSVIAGNSRARGLYGEVVIKCYAR